MDINLASRVAVFVLAVLCTLDAHAASSPISVLEHFRTYTGPRTPAAMIALFAPPVADSIRQKPEIALSDGVTKIKITVAAGSRDSKAANVAFNGAKLITLTRSNANEWDIEALPAAGALNVSLILLTDAGTREIPLTVAPAVPAGTDLSEKGFVAFLGETNAPARPLLDLNKDGQRDYVDDYIFTANYLIKPRPASDGPGAAQPTDSQPLSSDETPAQLVPGVGQAAGSPVSVGSQSPAVQDSGTVQTPYQRNLSDRIKRVREQSERRRGTVPVPESAPTVAPAK